MGGVCSYTMYIVHCTHPSSRVRSLCELLFHFLQVNFHHRIWCFQLESKLFYCTHFWIVNIFSHLLYHFILFRFLFFVTETYFPNNNFSVWQQNCKTVEHDELRKSNKTELYEWEWLLKWYESRCFNNWFVLKVRIRFKNSYDFRYTSLCPIV